MSVKHRFAELKDDHQALRTMQQELNENDDRFRSKQNTLTQLKNKVQNLEGDVQNFAEKEKIQKKMKLCKKRMRWAQVKAIFFIAVIFTIYLSLVKTQFLLTIFSRLTRASGIFIRPSRRVTKSKTNFGLQRRSCSLLRNGSRRKKASEVGSKLRSIGRNLLPR